MALVPKKPQRGENALQGIYNAVCQIIDYLPSLVVRGDNKTIAVNESNSGRTIRALNSGNNTSSSPDSTIKPEQDVFYAKITGVENNGLGYYVSIYENGYEGPASTSSYRLYVPELAVNVTLPLGTNILVHKTLLNVTGGNEQ